MSKVFEQAYKEFAQADIPDLWDRIEAGLSEKSTPAALHIDENKEVIQKETVNVVSEKNEVRKNNKVLLVMRKYSAVAAAIVCVAILIPAISLMGRLGIGGSKSEAAMEMAAEAPAAEAPAEMYEEAVAEEAPAEMIDEYVFAEAAPMEEGTIADYEAAMDDAYECEEAAVAEETEQAINNVVTETAETEEAVTEAVEMEVRGDSEEKKQATAVAGKYSLLEKCPEGTVVRDVQVKVTKVSEHAEFFEGTDKEEGGYICTAEVLTHTHGLLTEGEEIDIFISGYSSIALIKDGVFKLDLESFVEEEECYFVIKKYHMQLEP